MGGLNEAKKPEIGIEIFEKNRYFTPFLRNKPLKSPRSFF